MPPKVDGPGSWSARDAAGSRPTERMVESKLDRAAWPIWGLRVMDDSATPIVLSSGNCETDPLLEGPGAFPSENGSP